MTGLDQVELAGRRTLFGFYRKNMKTLIVLAALMVVAAISLGDVVMGTLSVAALACAGVDSLVRRVRESQSANA